MKFVKEKLYEDEVSSEIPMGNDPANIVIAQKIANGQAALNREDLKLQALKDKMIPINKRKAQIQKAMMKAQAENSKNIKAQAKQQAKQIKAAQEAQTQTQTQTTETPVATPAMPTTESLLQSDLNQIELLEDTIVVLMQAENPDYKKINKLVEEFQGKQITKIEEDINPMSRKSFYNLSEAYEDPEKKTKIEDEYIFYVKIYL